MRVLGFVKMPLSCWKVKVCPVCSFQADERKLSSRIFWKHAASISSDWRLCAAVAHTLHHVRPPPPGCSAGMVDLRGLVDSKQSLCLTDRKFRFGLINLNDFVPEVFRLVSVLFHILSAGCLVASLRKKSFIWSCSSFSLKFLLIVHLQHSCTTFLQSSLCFSGSCLLVFLCVPNSFDEMCRSLSRAKKLIDY